MILWICQTLIKDVLGALRPWMAAEEVRKGGGLTWAASSLRQSSPSGLPPPLLNSHCPGMAVRRYISHEPRGAQGGGPPESWRGHV